MKHHAAGYTSHTRVNIYVEDATHCFEEHISAQGILPRRGRCTSHLTDTCSSLTQELATVFIVSFDLSNRHPLLCMININHVVSDSMRTVQTLWLRHGTQRFYIGTHPLIDCDIFGYSVLRVCFLEFRSG